MITGIYKIVNTKTNEFYIGQSIDIERRWAEHKTPAYMKRNNPLAKAMTAFGVGCFKIEVLQECTADELNTLERHYIQTLKPQYNRNLGGRGNLGYKPSEATKATLRQKGKEQWERMSAEDKERVIAKQLVGPAKGHKVSEETRQKLRDANLGKVQSEATKQKRASKLKEALRGNTNRKRSVVCVHLDSLEVEIFPMIINAARYIKTDPTHLVKVLKRENKVIKGYYVSYLCSVETRSDECNSVGLEMSTKPKCVATQEVEEIVHAHEMANRGSNDKGLIQLAIRSGQFLKLNVTEIKDGELTDFDLLTGDISFKARPNRHELATIGYVAYFRLTNGFDKTLYMSMEEVRMHRQRFSKAKNSPWDSDFDAMAKKTVLKLLLNRFAPLSVEMQTAISSDQAVFRTEAMTPEYIDNPEAGSHPEAGSRFATGDAVDFEEVPSYSEEDALEAIEMINSFSSIAELDEYWQTLSEDLRKDRAVLTHYKDAKDKMDTLV